MQSRSLGRKILAIVLAVVTLSMGFGGTAGANGTPYPFMDNVENAAANNWLAESPWARTAADYHSASNSWTDSPAGYYANNLDIPLTLSSPIDLSAATKPQLKFWHHYQLEPGYDFGYVELSTDGGATFPNRLAAYSGTVTAPFSGVRSAKTAAQGTRAVAQEPWVMEQIDLTGYKGNNVKIRFRLVTDDSGTRDGWSIDDIAIAEQPPAVTLNAIANPTQKSLDLSWTQPAAIGSTILTATVTVNSTSSQPWHDSGLDVLAGNQIAITASGQVYYSPTSSPNGPDGSSNPPGLPSFLVPDASVPAQSLVGNISPTNSFQDGKGFFVGSNFQNTIPISNCTSQTGRLYLGYNDGFISADRTSVQEGARLDNSGSFTANVTITRTVLPTIRIYRSTTAGASLNSTLVANITQSGTITFTNTGLTSKTTYYYKVYTVNTWGVSNGSAEQSGTTLAGLEYPFFDNMEAGGNNWVATPSNVWTLVTPDVAHSGTKVWTDSPQGTYGNNTDAALVLANDITINPASQLTFWHRLSIATGDNASVELSTDNGATWTAMTTFTNQNITTWTKVQVDMGDYTGAAKVRFHIVTNDSGVADGWYIDDVGISDLPTAVTLSAPVPQPVPNLDKMQLTWTRNNDAYFQSYQIYRKNSAGVNISDTLIATITTQDTTTYLDSSLVYNTTYYYKVYVLSPSGIFNGSNEVNATTLAPGGVVAFPFTDDFENGVGNWVAQGTWALTTEAAHSGTYSWTDSPAAPYANSATGSLKLVINLGPAIMPILDFWQRYSLRDNEDFGFIEVSTDGTNWNRIYFITGGSADWVHTRVGLGEYAGQPQLSIRFRISSDAAGTADGWYIDDVNIKETNIAMSYPFFDNMDGSTDNWIPGTWGIVTPGHSTPTAWTDSPMGNYLLDNWIEMVLSGVLDLSDVSKVKNPRLSFWHKYNITNINSNMEYGVEDHDYGRVYVSNYYGKSGTWRELASFTGTQNDWVFAQVDLKDYVGLNAVRIKFVLDDNRDTHGSYGEQNRQSDGWYIDDVRVMNAPADVVLAGPAGATMHGATLNWSANADSTFVRYELYRSTGVVSRSSTLVASIDNQATTTFTDTYTILQPNYYHYRVYVLDQYGQYSLGSNEVVATYAIPEVSYPFSDNMESGTANWEWSAPWGQTTTYAHGGTTSWTDSPLGGYTDNASTALTTRVNLVQANSPILTFWHCYILEQNLDYGNLEVSTDGGNTWNRVLGVTGTAEWKQERISLRQYAGTTIGLRFRLVSDGAGNADGWYIDDVNINEGATNVGYPFSDNVESGAGSWLYTSPWDRTTELSHSATTSWTDSPFGNYANNTDATLWTTIDLSTAKMPILDYWQLYSFEENKDFGFIELSKDKGVSWNRIYFITGGSPDWINQRVDLTPFAGQAEARIRFRLVTDGSGTADGWYIDDVNIRETNVTISYPFVDNMESGTDKWAYGSWGLVNPGRSGANAWTDSPRGNYLLDNWMELMLGSTVDLSSATSPQLSFWHKYNITNINNSMEYGVEDHDYARVYVSNYYGLPGSWEEVANYTCTQNNWTRVTISLAPKYVGQSKVRVKFVLNDNRDTHSSYGEQNRQSDGWYIDDIKIGESDTAAPAAVADLAAGNVGPSSLTLGWTAPGNDGAIGTAAQYDIRYLKGTPLTAANWDTATALTGVPLPKAGGTAETFNVTGLTVRSVYYFAMKTVDNDLNWSALSNVLMVTTLANPVSVTVDAPAESLVGKDIIVRINIEGVESFDAANYTVTFDSTKLEIIDADTGTPAVEPHVTEGLIGTTVIPAGSVNMLDAGTLVATQNVGGITGVTGSGYLAEIHFHTLTITGAPGTTIALTNGTLSAIDALEIGANWNADSILIVIARAGDATGDELLDARDVTKIERIIVRLDEATPGADANRDSKVNALDITKAERLIVGLN